MRWLKTLLFWFSVTKQSDRQSVVLLSYLSSAQVRVAGPGWVGLRNNISQPHSELLVVVFSLNWVFSIKSVKYEKLLVYLFNQFFCCNTDRLGGNMSAVMEHQLHRYRTDNRPAEHHSYHFTFISLGHTGRSGSCRPGNRKQDWQCRGENN